MLIAHLSDLHLGYRAYHRLAPGGINIRERDVAQVFRNALDRVIELRPQLALIAGDIFHTVRPSNAAIADAFRQFARLRSASPETMVVVIAGNHDSPRSVETGSILRLFAEIPGIAVMDQAARQVYFESIDAAVLGVPHSAVTEGIEFRPQESAQTNIVVIHADTGIDEQLRELHDYGSAHIDLSDIRVELWDYVALGGYHKVLERAPNAFYPGAIERTSNNIWAELGPKGFLTYETETRESHFHELETRPVHDLKPIFDANQLSAAEIDEQIRDRVGRVKGGIESKIVRLVIHDLPRDLFRELNHRQIREYKAQALHFQLEARRPQARVTLPGNRRYQTLEEELEAFVLYRWQPERNDVERTRVLELARKYLSEAGSADAAELSAFSEDEAN